MTKLVAAGLTAVIAALAVWGTRRLVRARAETEWVALASALWFAQILIVASYGEVEHYSVPLLRVLVAPSALHNACLVAAAAAITRAAPVDPRLLWTLGLAALLDGALSNVLFSVSGSRWSALPDVLFSLVAAISVAAALVGRREPIAESRLPRAIAIFVAVSALVVGALQVPFVLLKEPAWVAFVDTVAKVAFLAGVFAWQWGRVRTLITQVPALAHSLRLPEFFRPDYWRSLRLIEAHAEAAGAMDRPPPPASGGSGEWAAVQDSKLIACTELERHVHRWVVLGRGGAIMDSDRRLKRLLGRAAPSDDAAVVYVTPALLGWEELLPRG